MTERRLERSPFAPPPRIPLARRARQALNGLVAPLAWLCAGGGALYLYTTDSRQGEVLAYAAIVEVQVTPEVDGKLATLSLEVGQEVQQGQVVATIDRGNLDDRIRMARLELERAGAHAGAPAGTGAGSFCGSDPQRDRQEADRITAEQEADEGERDTLLAQIRATRVSVEKHLVTGERLDELSTRQAILSKRIGARREQLAKLRDCLTVSADTDRQLRALTLATLEYESAKHEIEAPVTGKVENVLHRPGEWAKAGTPLGTIVVHQPDRCIAYLTDKAVDLVAVGDAADLTPELGGGRLHGKVIAVAPRIEPVPERLRFIVSIPPWGRTVTIQVDPPGVALPGQIYNVSFGP